eukprot:Phypoly_transcript_02350.p1 GENE.Phypoly_transcript_02350~~Phypoly_transcript_02350.p1  ORF type:complete len:840 (+),score=167.09 Phypoly_transcript_02350:149-2668(+)
MASRMNLSQIREAIASTMSEEVVLKGEVGIYTKDSDGGWKLFDENVCTLSIYKQPAHDMFRVVSMNPSRKCILNSWIKPSHSMTLTPQSFVEILNSSPTSPQSSLPDTIPLDGVGLSFTDPTFYESFTQQFQTCVTLAAETSARFSVDLGSQDFAKSYSAPLGASLGGEYDSGSLGRSRGSSFLPKSASTSVPEAYSSARSATGSRATFSGGSIGQKNGANLTQSMTITTRPGRKFSLTQRKGLKSINFDSPNLVSLHSVCQDIITHLDNLLEEVWHCLHVDPQVAGVTSAVSKVAEAIQMLSIITAAEFGEGHYAKDVILSNASAVQEELSKCNNADANVTSAVEKGLAYHASALRTTAASVGHHAVSVRGLSAQIETIVSNLQFSPDNDKPALLLVAVTRALANTVSALCSSILTYAVLNSPVFSQSCYKFKQCMTTDADIWDEVPLGAEVKAAGAAHATLNQLIALLVSDTKYDTDYMKMFITMYESFTNPYILLEKLTQRHNVPPTVDSSRVLALQLRVCVLLKYWVDNHGDEVDDDVASRIGQFIETVLVPAGQTEMAHLLSEQLRKKTEARSAKAASLAHIPSHILPLADFSSPADLLLLTPPSILAEQLTLIDFDIFKDIEPRELQNQSWNKADIKMSRSPNVMRLINRSTQVSYWVATMILMHTKVEDRVKVWEKIIDIAKALLKLNNFNTLMSIIGGLNNSCVFRLKKTKKKLLSNARDVVANIEKVMNTQQSFKNYRTALREANLPCLPYLGVHLSDLVFIEEGNPDNVDGEINVRKRELIYGVITQLHHYQQYPFTAQKHAAYDFLSSLPTLNEKELYTISMFLEPRK